MTYTYRCQNCGSEKEVVCKISEFKESISCEKCSSKMVPIIQSSPFILKGGGWSKDGYCKSCSKCDNKKGCEK